MIINGLKNLSKGLQAVLRGVVLLFTLVMTTIIYLAASAYLFLFED